MSRVGTAFRVILWYLMIAAVPVYAVEVGEPVPDFTVRTFDGNNLSRSALAGKPMLLVFWNTWCPDCMRELPIISRLAQRFVPRGLAILAVNTGLNDSES